MNSVQILRRMALLEGTSLLVLFLIAMPLKYIWGYPQVVSVVGMIHGILFMIFCVSLVWAHFKATLPWQLSAGVLASSFVPFGNFWAERALKKHL